MKTRNTFLAAIGLAVALGGAASAQSTFDQTHGRRAEVNQRLENQNDRIREARQDGMIGARKAHRLHMADRRIRREERRFAMHHHGRISPREQARLNRQENRISHRIG